MDANDVITIRMKEYLPPPFGEQGVKLMLVPEPGAFLLLAGVVGLAGAATWCKARRRGVRRGDVV